MAHRFGLKGCRLKGWAATGVLSPQMRELGHVTGQESGATISWRSCMLGYAVLDTPPGHLALLAMVEKTMAMNWLNEFYKKQSLQLGPIRVHHFFTTGEGNGLYLAGSSPVIRSSACLATLASNSLILASRVASASNKLPYLLLVKRGDLKSCACIKLFASMVLDSLLVPSHHGQQIRLTFRRSIRTIQLSRILNNYGT
ncbi:MAG: hypothetical protein OXC82_07240 [Rhodobacteraceae bacterium]|nr:hypothetical protein [Paracoccaceae bacterium]